jgi:hypothetical protein
MSSDAFADLGRSLSRFAEGLRHLMDANQRPAAGSPADKEADGEPWAGGWGLHPSSAVFATVALTTWSCTDHLSAAGTVLEHHRGISSLYTLTRGAAEAAAIACYLTEPGIGSLERVRRNLNYDLQAMYEDLNMLRTIAGQDAIDKAASHRERIAAIGREAPQHQLELTRPKKGSHFACYLGEKLPGAMALIDKSASRTSGVGARYQQLLSSVAHGQLHGLSRFLIHAPSPANPGKVISQMNVTAHDLALHLLAGPAVRRHARRAPALVLRMGHQRSRRDYPRHDARLGSRSRGA